MSARGDSDDGRRRRRRRGGGGAAAAAGRRHGERLNDQRGAAEDAHELLVAALLVREAVVVGLVFANLVSRPPRNAKFYAARIRARARRRSVLLLLERDAARWRGHHRRHRSPPPPPPPPPPTPPPSPFFAAITATAAAAGISRDRQVPSADRFAERGELREGEHEGSSASSASAAAASFPPPIKVNRRRSSSSSLSPPPNVLNFANMGIVTRATLCRAATGLLAAAAARSCSLAARPGVAVAAPQNSNAVACFRVDFSGLAARGGFCKGCARAFCRH